MKRVVILASLAAISNNIFSMHSPTLSPRSPVFERSAAEYRNYLEQTPPLFIAIESLAKASDTAALYPASSAAVSKELSSIGRDNYQLYHEAAEKFLSYD